MLRLLSNPLILIIITLLAGFFYFSLEKNAQKAQISISTIQNLQQDTEKLNQEVVDLTQKMHDAETPLAEERIIRNELLMQKPGEFVVQLAAFKEIAPQVPHLEIPETPWQKWKKILL